MNIMVTCDVNYVFPLLVLLESIFQNNIGIPINIYFLYGNMNDECLDRITNECKKYKQNFYPYQVDTARFEKIAHNRTNYMNLPVETYFRLMAGEILPQDVKKILYLDPDIIVNKSLNDFYNMDLENHVMAVCEDFGFIIRKDLRKKVYRNLNLNNSYKYFNTGVILFDLDRLRKTCSGEIIFRFLETTEVISMFADQCYLNYLFQDDVKYVDCNKYNCRPFHYRQNKRSQEKIIQEAVIIHYGLKPWLPDFRGMGGEIFLKYAKEIDKHFAIDYAQENVLKKRLNNIKLALLYGLHNIGRKREEKKRIY